MFDAIKVKNTWSRSLLYPVFLISVLCGIPAGVRAQGPTTTTEGTTPLGTSPGSPAGSYALSGFDNVNIYNGGVNLSIPLVHIGGRGAAGYTMMVPFNTKHWGITHPRMPAPPSDIWVPAATWWWPFPPGYGLGVLFARTSGPRAGQLTGCPSELLQYALTRLTFVAADGTEYELVDTQTGGLEEPVTIGDPGCRTATYNRGSIFTTASGPSITFISEDTQNNWTPVSDQPTPAVATLSGLLFFPDGTRYRIDGGQVSWIKDRNGNMTTFSYTNLVLTGITDPNGRQVTIIPADFSSSNPHDIISFDGFNLATRTIQVFYGPMLPASQAETLASLFPNLDGGSTVYNPTMVTSIVLPNQASYTFTYNPYGEVSRVVLPTGGAYEYDFTTLYAQRGSLELYRRLTERRVYPGGGTGNTFESRVTYQATTSTSGPPFATNVLVSHFDAQGNTLAIENHGFSGSPTFVDPTTDFPPLLDGKEIQIDQYDTNGTTILRSTVNTWIQNPVNWWPVTPVPSIGVLVETDTTLKDPNTPNLVSKEIYAYDKYNNRTDVTSYDFGHPNAGGKLRHSQTTFVTTNTISQNPFQYDAIIIGRNPIYLRSLPASQKVFDGGETLKAETDFEYDNYTLGLTLRSSVSGHDPFFDNTWLTRGNVTHVVAGLSGDNPSDVRSQYDTLGNVIQKTVLRTGTTYDTTTIDYDSAFQFAYPTKVTSPIPDPTGTNGQNTALVTMTGYDQSTGLVSSQTDANGNTIYANYIDSLDRISSVSRPDGGTTTFQYGDAPGNIYEKATTSIDSQSEVTTQLFDGLGRVTESQTSVPDSGGYVTVKRTYDGMGRMAQVSNPYKPAAMNPPESAVYTITAYDALSRVKSVTGTDGSVIYTYYANNQTLLVDQATNKRMSQSDGLGRLTDVWEITPFDSWTVPATFPGHSEVSTGYHTAYVYDALDDLTSVVQGAQQRTFIYDSLRRLKSAQNPESGTISYTYQNNGSLSQKSDLRPVTTSYSYDAINRLISRTYSDTTPAVTMKYDGVGITPAVTNPKGRPTSTVSSVSESDVLAYDVMGRTTKSQQVTNTGASVYGTLAYGLTYSYNLAGMMTDETYPSGKTAHTDYDSAARIAGVKNSATGTYYAGSFAADSANRIAYTSHGAVARMKLGNGLWEQTNYNVRLQPLEIGLGPNGSSSLASAIDGSKMDLVYDYGVTNNNGNVLGQTIKIANMTIGAQTYAYDFLNRLKTATENNAWAQTYSYDRWGNMAVTQSQNIGLTQLTPQDLSAFSTSNNNRMVNCGYDGAGNLASDQQGNIYSYDAENRMTGCTVGSSSSYAYDGNGYRVTKTTNAGTSNAATSVFVYDVTGKLVAEYGGSTSSSNAGTSYLTTDYLGSTRVVSNSVENQPNVVARHDYLPFGGEIGNIGGRSGMGYVAADDTRQRFTSKERDSESGLDYFGARYYGSAAGRFCSHDPHGPWSMFEDEKALFLRVPQNWNRYIYVTDNPGKYTDPDGLERYDNTVDPRSRQMIHDALVAVAKNGTKHQRQVAKYILENDLTFSVQIGTATSETSVNSAAANDKIASGWVSVGKSFDYVNITISLNYASGYHGKEELENIVVHEGEHAFQDARTVSSLSARSGAEKVYDPTYYQSEYNAYSEQAAYDLRRGGAYYTPGLEIGILEGTKYGVGKSEAGIRQKLESEYQVTKDNQGKKNTERLNLVAPR
jgi:RHS repeat-associated protein